MEQVLSAPDFSAPAPTPVLRPTTAKGFGPRAAAYLIDVLVIGGMVFLIGILGLKLIAPVLGLFGRELYFVEDVQYNYGLRLLDNAVTILLYSAVFEWLFGASIGKLVLGMRVVQLDGRLCGLRAALVRGAFRFFDGLVFGAVAGSSMSRDPELKQRLGDRAARTVVLDRRDPFIRNRRPIWGLLVAAFAFLVLAQVWLVAFTLLSGSHTIGPQMDFVSVTAAEANLQPTDFPAPFELGQESGPADFTGFEGTDINERLYVSGESVVQSRVLLFDLLLTDDAADLVDLNRSGLETEFEGAALTVGEAEPAEVGALAMLNPYSDPETGKAGWILTFRRSNAIVRMTFYAPPGELTREQALALARSIDGRLAAQDQGR